MSRSREAEREGAAGRLLPEPPQPGEMIELAEGILWGRVSMPYMLGHVNVFALEDPDGWTLVDAGVPSERCKEEWRAFLAGPLKRKPARRLVGTHSHPDHMGLTGWLMRETGAELWTSRAAGLAAYAMSRARWEDGERPPEIEIFYRGLGYDPEPLAQMLKDLRRGFSHLIHPLPIGFRALTPGEEVRLAGRSWRVSFAQGHAADQLILSALDESFVIVGDAILPENPAPLSVYSSEPQADPVTEFLDWAEAAAPNLPEAALVLPGHDLPFLNPRAGLATIVERDLGRSEKLRAAMAARGTEGPGVRATDVFGDLFRRRIGPNLYELAAAQAQAHLRRLEVRGEVLRETDSQGAWRYRATPRLIEAAAGAL